MSNIRTLEIVRQSPDFGFVDSQALQALAHDARLIRLRAGDPLWRTGDLVREVFIPEAGGLIRCGQHQADGAYINSGLIFLGHLIGEVEILGGITHRFDTAEALTNCDVVQITGPRFLEFISQAQWAKDYWLRMANIRYSLMIKRLYVMSRRSAPERLRGLVMLLLEYMPMRAERGLKLILKQDVLGRMADISRQTTNKILREWEEKGVIATSREEIFIIDPSYFVGENSDPTPSLPK